MPRVNLGRDPAAERETNRRNLIESYAKLRGYRVQESVAQAIKQTPEWYSRRLNGRCKWSLDDLAALNKVLRFSTEDMAALVCGTKGAPK